MHDDKEEEGVVLEELVQFLMHRMLFFNIVYTTMDPIADCINPSIKVFCFFLSWTRIHTSYVCMDRRIGACVLDTKP
jgi:hypothetical protein